MSELIIYGASGHAKVIIDILVQNGEREFLLVDDNPEITALMDHKVLRPSSAQLSEATVIIAVGNNEIRKKIKEDLSTTKFSTAIHPNAQLNSFVEVGKGTIIAAGTIINSDTQIGEHCIINTKASVDHDCHVADFVHIAPGATICGGVRIKEGTFIGAGATILPNLNIGEWATVAAGAVVTANVPDNSTVMGVPAKPID